MLSAFFGDFLRDPFGQQRAQNQGRWEAYKTAVEQKEPKTALAMLNAIIQQSTGEVENKTARLDRAMLYEAHPELKSGPQNK